MSTRKKTQTVFVTVRGPKNPPPPSHAVVSVVDRWLDVDQAAVYIPSSPQTIRGLIHKGELRAAQLGGRYYRIDRVDLDQLLIRRKRIHRPYRVGSRPWVKARHAKNRKSTAAKSKKGELPWKTKNWKSSSNTS